MDQLFNILTVAAGMVLAATSFMYIARPREALALLKRLGLTLAAVILGAALLQKILAETPQAEPALLVALLLASPVAYFLREAARKKPARKAMRRARERTRFAAGHPEEE